MAITFSTLEELETFIDKFELKAPNGRSRKSKSPEVDAIAAAVSEAAAEDVTPSAEGTDKPRRGRRKKTEEAVVRSPKKSLIKARPEVTLTSLIKEIIQNNFDNKEAFTANDVYDTLIKQYPKRAADIKKQSVITSVLKQMTTNFSARSEERPGKGPRPVKLYIPEGAKA